ncbi:MAG: hypothetical protein ACOH5I_09455 [Oligoflexus sp.]
MLKYDATPFAIKGIRDPSFPPKVASEFWGDKILSELQVWSIGLPQAKEAAAHSWLVCEDLKLTGLELVEAYKKHGELVRFEACGAKITKYLRNCIYPKVLAKNDR